MSDLPFEHCNYIVEMIEQDHLFLAQRDRLQEETVGLFRCIEQSSKWDYLIVFPYVGFDEEKRTRFKSSMMMNISTLRYFRADGEEWVDAIVNRFNLWTHGKANWANNYSNEDKICVFFSLSIYLGEGQPIDSLSLFLTDLSQLINEEMPIAMNAYADLSMMQSHSINEEYVHNEDENNSKLFIPRSELTETEYESDLSLVWYHFRTKEDNYILDN